MTARSESRSCPRCGVQREARKASVLCKSCRDVLSRSERKVWAR